MLRSYYLLAIGAGGLSFLLHLSLTIGGISGFLLAYIAPLPLMLVGLYSGTTALAIAGLFGVILNFLFLGQMFAILYAAVYVVPIYILCRQALLARPDSNTGVLEWYPMGRLVLVLAGIAASYFLIAVILNTFFGDNEIAEIELTIRQQSQQLGMAANIDSITKIIPYIPAIVAISWMLTIIINAALAQGILVRLSCNIRPNLNIVGIALPRSYLFIFGVTILMTMLDGIMGVIGKTLAAISLMPYFLEGLAAIHYRIRNWSGKTLVLIILYGFVLPFFWPAALVIMVLGLIAQTTRFYKTPNDPRDNGKE